MPLLGTPRGIWNVREIVNASARVACAAIDEVRLCRSLGIVPPRVRCAELQSRANDRGDAGGREAAAGHRHPLGAWPRKWTKPSCCKWPIVPGTQASKVRCAHFRPGSARATAFTPSDEQVAYYRAMRKAFAEGVARGTAAVPFPGGRMIDVPVDERARLVIDWWERCQRRDAEKAAARRLRA